MFTLKSAKIIGSPKQVTLYSGKNYVISSYVLKRSRYMEVTEYRGMTVFEPKNASFL